MNDNDKIKAISCMLWTCKKKAQKNIDKKGCSAPLPYLESMTIPTYTDTDIISDDDITAYVGMCYIEVEKNLSSRKAYTSFSALLWKSCWNALRRDYRLMRKSVSALTEYDAEGKPLVDITAVQNPHFDTEKEALFSVRISEKIKTQKEKRICAYIYMGYTYEEIADIMSTTEAAIKKVVQRMRKR